MKPYQFVILRYVNSIVSGESVNIGLLMWLPEERQMFYTVSSNYRRLSHFFHPFDAVGYRQMIDRVRLRFERIANDLESQQQVNFLKTPPKTMEEIQHSLVSENSSSFQWSRVRSGSIESPITRFDELAEELINRHEYAETEDHNPEKRVSRSIEQRLKKHWISKHLQKRIQLKGQHVSFSFSFGWNNGVPQVLQPISFDYKYSADIITKALTWNGRLSALSKDVDFRMTGVVIPPSDNSHRTEYEDAFAILSEAPKIRKILLENEIEGFISEIESDIKH